MNTGKPHIVMLATSLVAILLTLMIQACGNKLPSPEEVARKIDANEQLSQADYASMLDYCADYARRAQDYMDILNRQANDSTPEAVRATNSMATLFGEYPYLDMFRGVINNIPESALDKDNLKKVRENARYMAFPLPVGAGVNMPASNVVGDIVDMPDTDTGVVIATGDGEVVDVNVK